MESIINNTLLPYFVFCFLCIPKQDAIKSYINPYLTTDKYHIVKEGDSLSSISQKYYQNEFFWPSIFLDNPKIKDPNYIEKGMRLKIRAKPQKVPLAKVIKFLSPRSYTKTSITSSSKGNSGSIFHTKNFSITGPLSEDQITFLGKCESGMTPSRNSGNGYYGAFQFSYHTWKSIITDYERADLAPLDVQIEAVQKLLSRSSIWTQFPACAKKMQLAGLL